MSQARFRFAADYDGEIAATPGPPFVKSAWSFFTPIIRRCYRAAFFGQVTLGKGEVVSSILTRGTSLNALMQKRKARRTPLSAAPQTLQKLAKHDANATRLPWTSRGVRSARVGRAFSHPTAPSRAVLEPFLLLKTDGDCG